ncbi:18025_t:CDS:2 [Entrophospora sp. SA101]|nr:18025_t:CDS:2 [Entrophospora sp. SA101]
MKKREDCKADGGLTNPALSYASVTTLLTPGWPEAIHSEEGIPIFNSKQIKSLPEKFISEEGGIGDCGGDDCVDIGCGTYIF